MAERTPGKWIYDTYNTIFAGSEQTGDLVEICTIPDEPETGESRKRGREEWYPESQANAEFICVAVNAHDALVKALVAARRALWEACERSEGHLYVEELQEIHEALKLAKEGK